MAEKVRLHFRLPPHSCPSFAGDSAGKASAQTPVAFAQV